MDEWVRSRRRWLLATQNADGGWGYFPAKQSWLEPTAWAMLALDGDSGSERAWALVRSWQLPDGSWPACAQAREPHWTTALAVLLHAVRGVHDDSFRRGVKWLLETSGSENGIVFRVAHWLRPRVVEMDPSLKAWPWRPGTSSWIEPTAHALAGLRRAADAYGGKAIRERIAEGERMMLERRCRDGGWNYGNRRVLGADLPSYPETTAIALYGLKGASADLRAPVALARRFWDETRSPLARAWLRLALWSHGVAVAAGDSPPSNDVMVVALESIAATGVLA